MLAQTLFKLIAAEFPHAFTPHQERAVEALVDFILAPGSEQAFVLRGYAGTGKTTLIGALVRTLQKARQGVVLMAPTGRAAKVFAQHAGTRAFTIHKVIYRQRTFQGEGTRFSLDINRFRYTLFIVDEASMVATGEGAAGIFGSGLLLDDLMQYVYGGEGCKLLFVGDTAQLPPVGEVESPALQPDVLRGYGLKVSSWTLTEVVRQSADSGVLAGATRLRSMLATGASGILPKICGVPHGVLRPEDEAGRVQFLPGDELIEALEDAYADCGTRDTIVVTRSNKRANIYNNGIRSRIFDREDALCRGDVVMAVKNNYFWTACARAEKVEQLAPAPEANPTDSGDIPAPGVDTGLTPEEFAVRRKQEAARQAALRELAEDDFQFIANGDTAEIIRYHNVHEMHGFTFADATLRFPDYDDRELEVRVLLDTLQSEAPSLTAEQQRLLYERVLADYADIPLKADRMKAVREDPYYNALQIKYAYAVTCHKAQGGQWERVFVDQGYLADDMVDDGYIRWLYTAFTRTTDRLYLVNWPETQKEE